jgi:hypothetical protein
MLEFALAIQVEDLESFPSRYGRMADPGAAGRGRSTAETTTVQLFAVPPAFLQEEMVEVERALPRGSACTKKKPAYRHVSASGCHSKKGTSFIVRAIG